MLIVPVLSCTTSPCPHTELSSAGQDKGFGKTDQGSPSLGVGVSAYGSGERCPHPIPKPHSSMTLSESAYSFFPKIVYHSSLFGTANCPFCWTWAWQDGVISIWRITLVHSLIWCCKNRSGQLWEMAPEGSVWCWLRTETWEAYPPDFSSEPHHPDLLFITPIYPELQSLYQSPRWVTKSELLCTGPFGEHVGL